jgi:hypothetical protein
VTAVVTVGRYARAGLLVAVTCAAGCNRLDPPRVSAAQQRNDAANLEQRVEALKADYADVKVQVDPQRSRVTRLQDLRAKGEASSPEELARSILQTPAVRSVLGLSADLRELCSPVSRRDPQLPDYTTIRMQQCVNGIKVYGAELVMSVRMKPVPAIDVLMSGIRNDMPAAFVPRVSVDQAVKVADTAAATSTRAPMASDPSPELVVFVPDVFQLSGPSRLCWLVRRGDAVVFVDAISGALVHQYSEVQRGSIQ